ncbi:biliverdin-producing heme oxygenase [Xenophilus arseniciresistens]|uniref:Biliverdin-producing heme oxygenase n=1 Tax=Xenophilus arseniciresistens TaxID=1283306 RepID=A0AAE3NDL7_9BURK|nr:biliverdin-producing heme oxygenase [Xenophilus arseniciresistens]MDA7418901.1 biliverdin-producing heme oxygenase [Xenophilus arseniciresistens]
MALSAADPRFAPAACPDPRDALRRATAAHHAEVDAALPLSKPSPSLADYHAHLQLLAQWVALLQALPLDEPRLAREAAALADDIAECERLLGLPSKMPEAFLGTPGPGAIPDGFAWGVAYVIEGSRLGGQVLYRRLADALAPHPLHYLQGAGAQTGAHWRHFLEALRAALDTPERVQAACQGAVWAFEKLLQLRGASRRAEACRA